MMFGTIIKSVNPMTAFGEGIVRNVFLAGLGVYSKGKEQSEQTQRLLATQFNGFVEKGTDVEAETLQRVETTKSAVFNKVETQVNQVIRCTSGIDRTRLLELENSVDELTTAVDKLMQKK
ncbi:phasin-related domain-containing protein [Photobacterium sp.]|uniref:phasin-related domain-containing protein n=1 Tax=Photobacterium sp. TaxID=660 RepID=UPI00299D8960|nr:hypothetical protein [Photobacterium sp.]MDX1301594.1 hypothetical protein [Photobacterium sp.]